MAGLRGTRTSKWVLQHHPLERIAQDLRRWHRTERAAETPHSEAAVGKIMFPYSYLLAACACSTQPSGCAVRATSAAAEERSSLRAKETNLKHKVQVGTHRTSP